MANWHVISAYADNFAAWLRGQGLPHPAVRPGNQIPTTAEMKWALEADERLVFHYPTGDGELWARVEGGTRSAGLIISGFDWDADRWTPGDHFFIRGSDVLFSVLIRLCQRCGQLYLYPDSGAPAIVLDARLKPKTVARLHREACQRPDPWPYFFERMHGPGGLASEPPA